MKCSPVYQAGIFFSTSIFFEKLILADKSRLKKLTTLSAFTPASMSDKSNNRPPGSRKEFG